MKNTQTIITIDRTFRYLLFNENLMRIKRTTLIFLHKKFQIANKPPLF